MVGWREKRQRRLKKGTPVVGWRKKSQRRLKKKRARWWVGVKKKSQFRLKRGPGGGSVKKKAT